MRRVLAAFTALALCACGGSRPSPTEVDYSFGATRFVEQIRGLFLGGDPLGAERIADPRAADALEELAHRFLTATQAGSRQARLRIVDLSRRGDRSLTIDVDTLLTGLSTTPGERVASQTTFRLELAREELDAPWRLAGARRTAGEDALQHGRPHLTEEAEKRGLSAVHEPLDPLETTNWCVPATHHRPGVVLADFDGDGSIDVVLPSRRSRLFLNDGSGHFRDATKGSGLDELPDVEASGGVAADLDGDGLPELFLTSHDSPSRMLKNLGGGRFADVTRPWGLDALSIPATAAVFFDADRDGRVDLLVVSYGDARLHGPSYSGFNGVGNRFFHQVERDGHPFFVDETVTSGLGGTGWGLAASACDFDGDGDDDVYVANDFGINALYENRSTPGHVRFANITKGSGAEDEGFGMGVTWGDYDGDGRFDLYVADFWTPYRWILKDSRWPMPGVPFAQLVRPFMARKMARRSRGNGLFRNLGNGKFQRVSDRAGVEDAGWCWGVEFVDLDGKGREDLVAAGGMFQAGMMGKDDEVFFWNEMGRDGIAFHDGHWQIDFKENGMASRIPKKVWMNRGDGTFEERAWVEGLDTLADTRGLAYADLDGDGAPELVIATFRGPVLLYENGWTKDGGGRLAIRLDGAGTNRSALGALVRVTANGKTQMREVRAGSSYLSQSSQVLLVGLGRARGAEVVEVRWPDGRVETARDVAAGTRLEWREGQEPRRAALAGARP